MFKKKSLLKLGGCVLALGLLNAVINPGDEKEVKKEVQVVEEVKNEIDYNALDVEDIKEAVLSVVKEKTDKKKDRIVSIEVSEKNYVFIDLNANSSMNAYSNLVSSSKIFNELKKFTNVELVTISWHGTAIDDLGNEKEVEITRLGLSKELLNKINFEKFNVMNYEKYAVPYFVHPGWSIK